MSAGGKVTRVGGRGILIDDGGSGAWIGLRALRAVWRNVDATGEPGHAEPLAAALSDMIGGADWNATRAYVYGRDRGAIAELARAVAAAAGSGDRLAQDILADAGNEIARLARALIDRCGPAPVGLTGGIIDLHPSIVETVRKRLGPTELVFPRIDAAHSAARSVLQRAHAEARS